MCVCITKLVHCLYLDFLKSFYRHLFVREASKSPESAGNVIDPGYPSGRRFTALNHSHTKSYIL